MHYHTQFDFLPSVLPSLIMAAMRGEYLLRKEDSSENQYLLVVFFILSQILALDIHLT